MSSPLHGHAKKGDTAELRKVCTLRRQTLAAADYVAWVNGNQNKNQQTALHVAIQHGHNDAARVLLEMGSKLDFRDINGRTPWLYTGRYGNGELCELFSSQMDPTVRNSDVDAHGDSILHLAATHGHTGIIVMLLGPCQMDVNIQNKFGETALHKAARTDNATVVKLLLDRGADINIMGREGKARHVAHSDSVIALLRGRKDSGMDSPYSRSYGESPVAESILLKGPPKKSLPSIPVEDQASDAEESQTPVVEPLSDGVRKLLSSEANSSNSDLVHFKLKRALERSASPFMGGAAPVSEEQLASLHDRLRKNSVVYSSSPSSSSDIAVGEIEIPDQSSGVVVEINLAGGNVVKPAEIRYLFEPYRAMFGQRHFNFVFKQFSSPNGAITAIISVPATAEGNTYVGLLRTNQGYCLFNISAEEVRMEMQEGKLPQQEAIRQVLDRSCLSFEDLGDDFMSPRTRTTTSAPTLAAPAAASKPRSKTTGGNRLTVLLKSSLRHSELITWTYCEDQALSMELLALELKLGLPKTLCVGVVLVKPDQDEATAMTNGMSKELELFLSRIAAPVETLGWSGYSGGVSTKEHGTIYYSSWKGFEIVFHVAPLLSTTQRRQFIGNDKVMLYYLDSWRGGKQFSPKFRGHVNSVGIVVSQKTESYYKLHSFHRVGMADVKPLFTDEAMEMGPGFRDVLMSKIVNGHSSAYDLLYAERIHRAWEEELAALAEKHTGKKKKTK